MGGPFSKLWAVRMAVVSIFVSNSLSWRGAVGRKRERHGARQAGFSDEVSGVSEVSTQVWDTGNALAWHWCGVARFSRK